MSGTAVSIDGVLVEPERATISVFDRGLLYGDGCFEVLRTWNGVPIDLEAHLDRLYETVAFLELRALDRGSLEAAVRAAIVAAGTGEHRIRIVLTRGPGSLALPLAETGPARSIVIVEPLGTQPTELALAVVDWPLAARKVRGHKTLAYLDHVLARELARSTGADDAIRLDGDGNVVEGGTCNLFIVTKGRVRTPDVGSGALPGVVRARVLRICRQLQLASEVGPFDTDELHAASEVFATSSLRGVVPVTRVDGEPRKSGPVTARIATAYFAEMSGA